MALATKDYTAQIIQMRDQGATYKAIAEALPVSMSTVVRAVKAETQQRVTNLLAQKGVVSQEPHPTRVEGGA